MPPHIDERIAVLETRVDSIQEGLKDIELRVRSVEHTIWKAVGAFAVIQCVLGVLLKKYI